MCYKSDPVACQGNDFVTFNVDTERFGELADIQIVISNETEEVVKDIKVPGDAAPQAAPSLTVSGFPGNRFSTVEADPVKHKGLKADIVAMGGIGSCTLDINSSYTIYNLLNEQKKKGVAVIFVGEDLVVLIELCDRIMVIGSGRITGIVDGRNTTKEEIGLLMTKSKREEVDSNE